MQDLVRVSRAIFATHRCKLAVVPDQHATQTQMGRRQTSLGLTVTVGDAPGSFLVGWVRVTVSDQLEQGVV